MPYIGTSIFLVALGAVLAFAVTADTAREGFSVQTAGVVLLIVGGLALVLSLLWQFVLSDRRRADSDGIEPAGGRPPEADRVVERERRVE